MRVRRVKAPAVRVLTFWIIRLDEGRALGLYIEVFHDGADNTFGENGIERQPDRPFGNASTMLWRYQRNEVPDNRVTSRSLRQE